MMLPIVMEYNAECTGEKYREIARAMGVKGVDDMSVEEYRKAAIDAVQQLSVDVGIPTKLEALKEEDLEFLAESAILLAASALNISPLVNPMPGIYPSVPINSLST